MTFVRNPVILALDVDTIEDARKILDHVGDMIGGVKVGPRLVYKYGASLVQEFSEIAPVFVDNKYFDIPSTMDPAVRASFQAGASLVTVPAPAARVGVTWLAALAIELNL